MTDAPDRKKEFWKRKLLAFLHDPPTKPLDIPGHKEVAEAMRRRAGFTVDEILRFTPVCDHTAAAADRFPFPDPHELRSEFTGSSSHPFYHPLGGSDFIFGQPFADASDAETIFQVVQPGGEAVLQQISNSDDIRRAWANFFLHWRRWPEEAARKDDRTAFLPADTRLPDHSVWTHNTVVSALEACVEEGRLRPAFLLFQLGPVQEFIAQARSTRDLWSGSYLISWLTAHALKAVTDEIGPDCVLFPSLRGHPLFDFLHREALYDRIQYPSGEERQESLWERMGIHDSVILTPSLPNRFLAIAPVDQASELARAAHAAVTDELVRIANSVKAWLAASPAGFVSEWSARFDHQVRAFPKVAWQVAPWPDRSVADLLEEFKRLSPAAPEPEMGEPGDSAENLARIYELATRGIPLDHRDSRCFSGTAKDADLNNPGFCWSYLYKRTDWLLAARRRLRDFDPWPDDPTARGAVKDSLSGVEEVVGSEDWWRRLKEVPETSPLFRSADRLGAMNLVKRIWHLAYLKQVKQLRTGSNLAFESVPGVAAGLWRRELLQRMEAEAQPWERLQILRKSMRECESECTQEGLIMSDADSEREWLLRTDPDCFRAGAWREESPVRTELRRFFQLCGVRTPPSYYAVLAFDGDQMGQWVSGAKAPALARQFSIETCDYFQNRLHRSLDGLQRPLSPSYHLQFSEALTNFGLYIAAPVVEHFGGQLIYSGGDDVLAMLPASAALDCAEALHAAFRGEPRLQELVPGRFEVVGTSGGFIRLETGGPRDHRPNWPLIVPGPRASASVGIALGHIHAPLQGLVREAQSAERRAKRDLGRSACAVSLFKRSGEIVHWGFKWDSGALPLYRRFVELSSGGEHPSRLSQRFGYALHQLLRAYLPQGLQVGADRGPRHLPDFPIRKIVELELRHVLQRQGAGLQARDRKDFLDLCGNYLDGLADGEAAPLWKLLSDFPLLFDTANFIRRGN